MERIRILDPTAPPPEVSPDPGPGAGSLAGKTIGLRIEGHTWRSWLETTEQWAPRLEASGARLRWWDAGSRVGDAGERTRKELDAFVRDIDIAVVGLGN